MCDTYHFRLGCDEKQLSRIFKDSEISKAFETVFMENYWLILNRIREYKDFIQSKNIPNEDGTLPFKLNNLDEDIIIQNFKHHLQVHILYLAINDIFSSKLDIKANILGVRFLCSFNELVSVLDPDTGVYYTGDIGEDLIFEFLHM